ncbi:hypothetical protein F4804DRAFT_308715 [Jackrogersella minutella]|nr:hypothetical protein F4804DRAFT_308715 [Jackrogersella minutella]
MRSLMLKPGLITKYRNLHIRKFGSQSIPTERISLLLSTKASKETAIKELNRHLLCSPSKPSNVRDEKELDYGAAIFASCDLATWIEDERFMSGLLQSLLKSYTSGNLNAENINVLCTVADGLTPKQLFSEPQTGFSILHGPAKTILPDLWELDDLESNNNQHRESSVSFLSNPLPRDTEPLEITLPLANTLFQNGRRSTLLASRWKLDRDGSMTHAFTHEKRTQAIRPPVNPAGRTTPFLPLLPLTPPRKIVAGLGNIIRQVEVNGSPTPASKELEGLIPKVFDIRSTRDASYMPGPIGVWCWVLPPNVVEEQSLLSLKGFQVDSSQSEAELSLESMTVFSEFISSGCRLHKILSGGGGWGLKQGLLSLDPETNYSLPDQDDVETFIRAFQARDSPNQSEGLVTPGSYIMFCIEPHWTEKEIGLSQQLTPNTALGVIPNNDQESDPAYRSEKIEVIDNHFGVVSKAGLFLKATTLSNTDKPTEQHQTLTTKVDFPRATFLL